MNSNSIKASWEAVLENVNDLCIKTGRQFNDITVVGVSKKQPVESIIEAYKSGCKVFGENYIQELESKVDVIKNLDISPEFHFTGSLQRNKVKKAILFSSMIQTVDSLSLAREINKEVEKRYNLDSTFISKFPVLIQVNVSGEEQKGGFIPDSLNNDFEKLIQFRFLNIKGLMTIGSISGSEELRIEEFSTLRKLKENIESRFRLQLSDLSMGMSSDYEIAIKEGATIVRIGSAIFGERE